MNFDMTPDADMQIVVWIEDAEGNFVDTAFITRTTGSYGLGNRPGIMEFNSGPDWCYGRRETTFPVWAHRHGMDWPLVIFQDEDDSDLSHAITQSSVENTYCRPLRQDEPLWDAETCATVAYTDKGKFDPALRSLYPPRSDVAQSPGRDSGDVPMMSEMNPFDAISKPTPPGGQPARIVWAVPEDLPIGNYVAWVEVSKEFDPNGSYDFPSPVGLNWSNYGIKYRGQPSVIHSIPFSIGEDTPAMTMDYIGYGDPEGLDGDLRAPDSTITAGVAGSGASRLLLAMDGNSMYRVRVQASSSNDDVAPGGAGQIETIEVSQNSATLRFIAPGDDDQEGTVSSYEIRYLAGQPVTAENWDQATVLAFPLPPRVAGTVEEIVVDGLLPNTNYSVGIRATDECLNEGEVVSVQIVTPKPIPGGVDACFVATAAYGSLLANEVVALRSFRDRYLRSHPVGELFVESYYTVGPAFAKLIEGSPLLRRAARAALSPLVKSATGLSASGN